MHILRNLNYTRNRKDIASSFHFAEKILIILCLANVKTLKSTESATRCHLKWLFPCSAGISYSCCYFLIVLSYAFKLLFLFSLYLLNPKADPFCSTAQHHNITRRTSVFCSHSRFHFFWLFYLTGAISNWRKFSTSFKFFRLPTSTKLSYL